MIVESTTRTPPSRWPVNNSRPAPAWRSQPTRPRQQPPQRPNNWLPYVVLGVTALVIGSLATIVVVLAR
ncbi:hypothetical protein GA0074696_2729 [Micromonospora purpureochromogenes]|uniref:Uncharacterized protein n=1 Tax=Micromonospora purpureochromogenes TaxID=47872 RepID=A0A1C4XNJ8_9ACTN|nr:hypothetical protein GA0074696_2729 [Micromonospora purpureochromogenes]